MDLGKRCVKVELAEDQVGGQAARGRGGRGGQHGATSSDQTTRVVGFVLWLVEGVFGDECSNVWVGVMAFELGGSSHNKNGTPLISPQCNMQYESDLPFHQDSDLDKPSSSDVGRSLSGVRGHPTSIRTSCSMPQSQLCLRAPSLSASYVAYTLALVRESSGWPFPYLDRGSKGPSTWDAKVPYLGAKFTTA